MKPKRPIEEHRDDHETGFVEGLLAITLRIAVMFGVIGAGYYVIENLGESWFRVFVFAAIAACLHFELRRIEREFPDDDG